MRRLEEREPDLDAEVLDPVPQDVDRPALVDLLREPLEEARARAASSPPWRADELLPRVGLRRLDEREAARRDRARAAVEASLRVALRVPAVLEQPRLDLALELPLGRAAHAAAFATSSWPVTAAVISAWRCSRGGRSAARSRRRCVDRPQRSPDVGSRPRPARSTAGAGRGCSRCRGM